MCSGSALSNFRATLELTFYDVRDALEIAPGAYRLRSGEVLCFLNPPTYH